MIDFRYHLVSLVSVFLALAVGIVLGAGPLKEPIGESLQNQVDALRSDRDDLRTQLEVANGNVDKQNTFITAAAPEIIGDTLDNQKVSVLALPDAATEQSEAVVDRIAGAGGSLSADVSFVPETLQAADSKKLLTQLRDLVPELPQDDASAIRVGLVIALTGEATTIKDKKEKADAQKQASKLFSAFVDAGRLRTDADFSPNDLLVILDDEKSQLAADTEPVVADDDSSSPRARMTDFVSALTAASTSVVVAGDAGSAQNGLVSVLRDEKSLASTVDGLDLSAGAVITVRALARGAEGQRGHYGFAADADSVLPEPVPTKES